MINVVNNAILNSHLIISGQEGIRVTTPTLEYCYCTCVGVVQADNVMAAYTVNGIGSKGLKFCHKCDVSIFCILQTVFSLKGICR